MEIDKGKLILYVYLYSLTLPETVSWNIIKAASTTNYYIEMVNITNYKVNTETKGWVGGGALDLKHTQRMGLGNNKQNGHKIRKLYLIIPNNMLML